MPEQAYDANGMPIEESYGPTGYPTGSVAEQARAQTAARQAGQDIPKAMSQQPPLWQRFLGQTGMGLPTSLEELTKSAQNQNPVTNFIQHPGVGTGLGLMAGPPGAGIGGAFQAAGQYPANMYEGKYPEAAGNATTALLSLLGARGITNNPLPPGATPIYGTKPTLGASLARSIPFPKYFPQAIQDWMGSAKKVIGYNMGKGEYGPALPAKSPTAIETLAATDPNQLPITPGAMPKARPANPPPYNPPVFQMAEYADAHPGVFAAKVSPTFDPNLVEVETSDGVRFLTPANDPGINPGYQEGLFGNATGKTRVLAPKSKAAKWNTNPPKVETPGGTKLPYAP